jgi:hypothetical protein
MQGFSAKLLLSTILLFSSLAFAGSTAKNTTAARSIASSVSSDVIFEGYFKMMANGSPIGFFVQRFEVDPKTKNFKSIYFVSAQVGGLKSSESLKAECTKDFAPVSYQYTMTDGTTAKTIDATFNGDVMIAKITDGKKTQTVNRKLKKGTFLSTFLGYLMLSKGLKDKTTYNYFAIAEEDALSYTGRADVLEKTNHMGVSAFKMKNTFKDAVFDSYMSDTGEVLSTASMQNSIATQLVADKKLAVTNTAPFDKALQLLFGGVPAGTKNILNKK